MRGKTCSEQIRTIRTLSSQVYGTCKSGASPNLGYVSVPLRTYLADAVHITYRLSSLDLESPVRRQLYTVHTTTLWRHSTSASQLHSTGATRGVLRGSEPEMPLRCCLNVRALDFSVPMNMSRSFCGALVVDWKPCTHACAVPRDSASPRPVSSLFLVNTISTPQLFASNLSTM